MLAAAIQIIDRNKASDSPERRSSTMPGR